MKVYGIKNCDSVKKVIKYLKDANLEYDFIDFKLEDIDEKKITSWLKLSKLEKLFNARSTTYRTLKLKEQNLSDADKINLMAKENLLIKRPVIEFDGKVIIGFNKKELDKII